MANVIIEGNSPQAMNLLAYIETFPFATVVNKPKKKSFREAAAECNAISVDEFVDELERQIKEHFRKNA